MQARQVAQAAAYVRARIDQRPKIGIILGSGMGGFASTLSRAAVIRTDEVPHYPHSTVEGHSGAIVCGKLKSVSVLVLQGRVHYYESGDLERVLFPVRVAHRLGVRILLMTNAAGGVNPDFRPADLMLMTDHINLTLENPLTGAETPVRGGDLYDAGLQDAVRGVALEEGMTLREGVYCGIKGPSYETAAEVEMIRRIGGDAIGMSTVNESSLAHALGVRVAGISLITNLATGLSREALSHAEVTDVAGRANAALEALLTGFVGRVGTARS
jgi:purine-nucleoside phosphorylase